MIRFAVPFKTFLAIALPFFRSEQRLRARALLAGVIAVELAFVYLAVLVNEWNAVFYNALEDRNWRAFLWALAMFTGLAVGAVVIAVAQHVCNQWLVMRWREWMTERYVARWLADGRLYRVQFVGESIDNIHLRIANDIHLFIQHTLDLGTGLLGSVVTLASFTVILWALSSEPPLIAFGINFAVPGYLVWIALIYAGLGTLFTHLVGRSLIPLDFNQQRRESDLRSAIARVADHAEPIAEMGGEAVERTDLGNRFGVLVANWKRVIVRQSQLSAFITGYAQMSTVFPVLVASPAYFAGIASLGALMQAALAFQKVETALAFFVGAYAKLAEWKALVDRLSQFEAALDTLDEAAANSRGIVVETAPDGGLETTPIVLHRPSGTPFARVPAVSLKPGDRLLLAGPSGSGKSSFFRAVKRLWPFGEGRITLPDEADVMAIPQRSYFPLGTLKAALAFPVPASDFDEAAVRAAMEVVGLDHLVDRLDEEADWRTELSGGEQQRAALVGPLLRPPRILLLDEPVSSLDEQSGRDLFMQICERLPQTIIISIGRRSVLGACHERIIELRKMPARTRVRAEPALEPSPKPT